MDTHELQEHTEHAHHSGEKGIGLTTAIVAVLLAVATQMSHRSHTEEIKLQTETNDKWSEYQAKHGRAHEYGVLAEFAALLPNGKDVALKDLNKSVDEECGTPPEKGCNSPVWKESKILQQLVSEAKSSAQHQNEESGAASAGVPATASSAAEHSAAKSEKHEKSAGKEGGGAEARESAKKVRERAEEMERETQLLEQKANLYDGAELFLEISIVLCSIALLAENKMYWKLSFISTLVGVAIAVWGLLLR